ncbi:SGNH/GDSL hydrolase family protein [Rhodococcus antarcticus]|uniref:SGNH/GDSL hydrolase family protein n=1 Tax=Rhodococcus antarcticus TaxID=2987751 RepID=A0ABY6P1D8_9NOCA|nr:SGNH/GDSL hydrolase family protein [Rhodococcus antarcticus]UZJ25479.1 SGNH/GDSL hydrolase family protein [Rhodococcus antarcticus]
MRRIASLVTCAALVGVGLVGITTTADAKTTPPNAAAASIKTSPYVALGDSYSSGAGILPQVAGSPGGCLRSTVNYSEVIAKTTHPAAYTDVTCSGARTTDFFTPQKTDKGVVVAPPQLDAVSKDTRLVTMTISGNDGGVFFDTFFGCAFLVRSPETGRPDPTGSPCKDANGDKYTKIIEEKTYPALVKALSAVRAKAPRASIVILGYPQILPPAFSPACFAITGISEGDVPWLLNQGKVANDVVRRAAAATGARYVDTATPSTGHDACSGPTNRWMEPLVAPVNALPVHPNAIGEAALASETLAAIGR